MIVDEPVVEAPLGRLAELVLSLRQVVDVLGEGRQHQPGLLLPSQLVLGKALQRWRDEGVGQRQEQASSHLSGDVPRIDQLPQLVGLDPADQRHRAPLVGGGVPAHADGRVAVAVEQLEQLRFTSTTAVLGVPGGLAEDAFHLVAHQQNPSVLLLMGLELHVQTCRRVVLDLTDHLAWLGPLGLALVCLPVG